MTQEKRERIEKERTTIRGKRMQRTLPQKRKKKNKWQTTPPTSKGKKLARRTGVGGPEWRKGKGGERTRRTVNKKERYQRESLVFTTHRGPKKHLRRKPRGDSMPMVKGGAKRHRKKNGGGQKRQSGKERQSSFPIIRNNNRKKKKNYTKKYSGN